MSFTIALRRQPSRLKLLATLLLLTLSLSSCEEASVFGLPAARFEEIIESGELEALLSLPPERFADPGPLGPEAYFYLARWIELQHPAPLPPPAPMPPASALLPPASTPPSPPPRNGLPAQAPEESLPPALGAEGSETEPSAIEEMAAPIPPALIPREKLLAEELYRLSSRKNKGLLRAESGKALLGLLAEKARAAPKGSQEALQAWESILATSQELEAGIGHSWETGRIRLAALEALGKDAELRREGAELASAFPAEALQAKQELLYFEAISSLHLGRKASVELLRSLLESPASAWTESALLALEGAEASVKAELGTALPAAARLRLAVRDKDYAAAYRASAAALPLILDPKAEPSLVAELGKAYLYSGMSKEGLALFESIAAAAGMPAPSRPLAWNAAFYRARFLRAFERWKEAAASFLSLGSSAPKAEDADAALWYAADSAIRQAGVEAAALKLSGPTAEALRAKAVREKSLAALLEIAPLWHEASRFSDLAEPLLRSGLAARDWSFIEAYGRSLGPRLTPTLASRASYIAARARELGYLALAGSGSAEAAIADGSASTPPRDADLAAAAAGYRSIMDSRGGSLYYRLLAARRLGLELSLIPPPVEAKEAKTSGKAGAEASGKAGAEASGKAGVEASGKAGAEASGKASAGPTGEAFSAAELSAFIEGFLKFRMGEQAYEETIARLGLFGNEELRALAESFSRSSRYADSMRLVLALMRRESWDPRRRDYELLYPRPFIDEIRAIRPRPIAPEHILFGLVRSESFFRHEVLSRAGAIGLSQLMPGTAAETARSIGLGSYDLEKPADNLKIGFAHFGALLEETGGRPLRAMFAYNAGRSRLRRWLAESGELPEDLLLEALSIEETRQYGRNILEASAFYGELYYGLKSGEVVDELLEGLEVSRR